MDRNWRDRWKLLRSEPKLSVELWSLIIRSSIDVLRGDLKSVDHEAALLHSRQPVAGLRSQTELKKIDAAIQELHAAFQDFELRVSKVLETLEGKAPALEPEEPRK
jgi:hypothetical protein